MWLWLCLARIAGSGAQAASQPQAAQEAVLAQGALAKDPFGRPNTANVQVDKQ
jgi:hypothetical protein